MSIQRTINKNSNAPMTSLGYSSSWERPTDWTELPEVTTNRFVGLYAVFDSTQEYVAIGAAISAGTYTVDWGDGTITTHANLSNAEHQYTYADVTGSVCSRGYKTALIQVYPTTGGATLSTIYTNIKHTAYKNNSLNWLDMCVAVTNNIQVSSTTVIQPLLERFIQVQGTINTLLPPFYNAYNLQYISSIDIGTSTTTASMFYQCKKLEYIPEIRTGGIGNSGLYTMTSMFNGCTNLKYIPVFETYQSLSHACGTMFVGCSKLEYIPALKLSPNTALSMFGNCYALRQIDAILYMDICTTTQAMFASCYALVNLPDLSSFSTNLITTTAMFNGCSALNEIKLFDTSNVTTATQMFYNCSSLTSLPNFNLNKAGGTGIFQNCTGLTSVPTIVSTSALQSLDTNYSGCTALQSITASYPGPITTFTSMFPTPGQLKKLTFSPLTVGFSIINNLFSYDELVNVINQLRPAVAALSITGNPGIITPISKTTCGMTAKSVTITQTNTAGLTIGMQATGTGTPMQTNTSFTTNATTYTFTLVGHNIPNDTPISVAALTTTTGITLRQIYYVVNATTDTLQLSTTVGGSPITFTNNGSCTMRWKSVITAITTNTSITMSAPMATTGTQTLSFQTLPTWIALLQGWSVTQ